jgi:hypothetical protein
MIRRFWLVFLSVFLLGLAPVDRQGEPILGTIRDEQPFVEIPIFVAEDEAGSTIQIRMSAINGNLDPFLYLVDANGNIIDENDDRATGDLDSQITFVQAPAGEYTVIATRFGVTGGDTVGDFRLEYLVSPPVSLTEQAIYDVTPESLASAGFPQMEPRPRAEWTVLAYYGGDTDLEASVMNDLDEFEVAGGSDETVRVVALLDRSPQFATANDDWKSARLFEISADVSGDADEREIATLDSEPLADLGVLDTGDGETLAQFLVWAMTTYPAERYALAFASHGAGWRGIVSDETGLYSLMSVPDVQKALATARDATGVQRLDLLINDACSMGSVEYHAAMAPFFDVSFASPEIVVNPALDMTLFTEGLRADPDQPMAELGATLIDRYIDVDIRLRSGIDRLFLNHAVIDLNAIDPITQAVDAFAAVFQQDPLLHSIALGQARANAYTYSAFIGDDSTVDLGNLMQQVIANSSSPELVAAARDVLTALDGARLYGRAASGVETVTSYYSIYFPQRSSAYRPDYLDDSPLKDWGAMLRSYFNAITPRLWVVEDSVTTYHPPIAPEVTVTRVYPDVSSSAFPPTISVEVVGRRIASGALTIDRVENGQTYRLVETPILTEVLAEGGAALVNNWRAGVDQAIFNWLPLELPVVSDGETNSPEFLRRSGDTASLEGRYRETLDDEWQDVSVVFDLEGETQTVISRGRTGALATIEIPSGSEFQVYRYLATPDGELKPEPGTRYIWPAQGLSWRNEPTASGTYQLGFLVRAFGGVSGFDSTRIEVDNAAYDESLLGYADIDLGINFQRPAGWSPVIDQGNWLTSSSPDGDATLNVYYFRALDNVYAIKEEVQKRYGIDQSTYSEVYRGHDDIAVIFGYQYQLDDGSTWTGEAVAFHRETAQGGRGLVFTVDTRDGSTQAAQRETLFDNYLNSIAFFDAERLADLDTSRWRYEFLERRIPYPMRNQWRVAAEGDWTVYTPPNEPRRLVAVAGLPGEDTRAALDDLLFQYGVNRETAQFRLYNGEYHDWETAQYSVNRDGVDVIGRIYVAKINNRLYGLRFETPDNAIADEVIRYTFEPILDGFAPPGSSSYAAGNRNAFVKSALVSANDICRDSGWNTVCYVGQQDEALRAIYVEDGDIVPREVTDTAPVERMLGFQVGVLPDGSFDPFSVAVLTLQANLPDDNADESIQLIVFGGATVFNRSVLEGGQVPEIQMIVHPDTRELTDRINMRRVPASDAFVNGAFGIDDVVTAVGRSDDGEWLRVQVPNDPSRTGWVRRTLLLPEGINPAIITFDDYNAWQSLPLSNPNRPHWQTMQSVEIQLAEESQSGAALNGVLIQTTPSDEIINLEINGAVFEIAGGSMFFWRGSFNDLETVSTAEQDDVFDDTVARRRPSGWESEVLSGSVRIQLADTGSDIQRPTTVTGVAGTSVQFDSAIGNQLQLQNADVGSGSLGSTISETFTLLPARFTDEEIAELLANQDAVNALELGETSAISEFFLSEAAIEGGLSEDALFDFLFDDFEEEAEEDPAEEAPAEEASSE